MEKTIPQVHGVSVAVGIALDELDDRDSMIEAANFDKTGLLETITKEYADKGFFVGQKVRVKVRFTAEFTKGAGGRKDINVGEHVFVRGMTDKQMVVHICREVNGVEMERDVAVKATFLDVNPEAPSGPSAPKPKAEAVPKGYEYLRDGSGASVTVRKGWEQRLTSKDPETQINGLKHMIGFNLATLTAAVPALTAADITICKRGEEYEVHSHRDFKAGELILVSDTNEIRDRYWTAKRSVLCKHGELLHPSKKHIVLDGTRRAVPSDVRPFSPFYTVTRSSDTSVINMAVDFAETKKQGFDNVADCRQAHA